MIRAGSLGIFLIVAFGRSATLSTKTYPVATINTDTLHWRLIASGTDTVPVAGALVRFVGPDGLMHLVKSDVAGYVRLVVADTGVVEIDATGFRPSDILLHADGAPVASQAHFVLRRVLKGTVVDLQQRPVAGAVVEVDSALGRDTAWRATRTPLAHGVSDADGHVTLAPRVIYFSDGHVRYNDLITAVAFAKNRTWFGLWVPTDEVLKTSARFTVAVAPMRRVHLALELEPAGMTPDPFTVEALLPTWNHIAPAGWRPRNVMSVAMHRVDSTHWAATVPLPVNMGYVIHASAGTLNVKTEGFQVASGDTPFDAPMMALDVPAWEQQGTAAPDLAVTTLEGKSVHLGDYAGKVVVLTFWGGWSSASLAQLPALQQVASRFRDSNVVVLAVHDATVGGKADYQVRYGDTVTKLTGGAPEFTVLADQPTPSDASFAPGARAQGLGQTIHTYGVTILPTIAVVDRGGHLVGGISTEPTVGAGNDDDDSVSSGDVASSPEEARKEFPERWRSGLWEFQVVDNGVPMTCRQIAPRGSAFHCDATSASSAPSSTPTGSTATPAIPPDPRLIALIHQALHR